MTSHNLIILLKSLEQVGFVGFKQGLCRQDQVQQLVDRQEWQTRPTGKAHKQPRNGRQTNI